MIVSPVKLNFLYVFAQPLVQKVVYLLTLFTFTNFFSLFISNKFFSLKQVLLSSYFNVMFSSLTFLNAGYEARILGPSHVQVHQGQTANLTCTVTHGGPSPNITWFLNDIPLQKTSNTRGGINIDTEKSPFATISKLVIVRVDRRDEGKYSCGGITVYPDSVVLRVLPFRKSQPNNITISFVVF